MYTIFAGGKKKYGGDRLAVICKGNTAAQNAKNKKKVASLGAIFEREISTFFPRFFFFPYAYFVRITYVGIRDEYSYILPDGETLVSVS